MDRIDWILHSGPASTVDSRIIGETGGPDVDLGFAAPYPTDHRGVLSTLSVTPKRAAGLRLDAAAPDHGR